MPRYLRPPIVERVASIWAPMTPEVYEGRFESWRSLVEQELPVYEPVKQWLINVRQKDGIPLYDTIAPELKITPRFSKKPSKEGFDWSIRCPSGQLTMNMHSAPGDRRGYPMLRMELARWLPRWISHFDVKKATSVTLQYVNRLDPSTLPAFTRHDGLRISDVLKIFVQVPGRHQYLVPPCDCNARVLLAGRDESTMQIHLQSAPGTPSGMRLDFVTQSKLSPEESDAEHLIHVIDWAHDQIIERFEAVFTEDAKESFEVEKGA